jgi:hypothetical protein
MKRKPDLLWILVILFGLGVVTTGYAQSLWSASWTNAIRCRSTAPHKR